uniref:SWIM-type domain-containing protein n=1 Tax=Setaria italica TaxID=4555 RepID=K3ZZ47_SETIT
EDNGSQELTKYQIKEFIRSEQLAAAKGNNANIDSKYTPQMGMQFKDRYVAHHFFCFYTFLARFEVVTTHTTRTTSRKRNNGVFKVEMKCHRYGKEPKINEKEEEAEEEWMQPRKQKKLLTGRKYMSDMEKAMIRTLNGNKIPTRKMVAILSYLRGGMLVLPYKNKDVANYRTKINREVTGNDMTKALEYFRKRKSEDPTFFYEFSFDEDKKVKNIFWREGCSLKYYAEYGDCVSFDATYMTNRYNLLFAPFVGVTGHGHTCMFGWKHPKTIITDQDKAMKVAIKLVFPNTIHKNCFFHIKYKCYNKNGVCFAKKKGLVDEFEDIVNNLLTKQEFDILWQKMIIDHGLQENKYFKKMWENRANFIPVWFKNNFYPFLQSIGRSEGSNARLKENVGSTYSIINFLKEFQRMVDATNIKEDAEDKQSKEKTAKQLMFAYNVEKQASDLYNKNIFKKYTNHTIKKYIVLTDLTEGREDFYCICGKFNKDGILCAHILKVILEEEINQLTEKYIIDRRRKKDNKMNLQLPEVVPKTNDMLRFNKLSRRSVEINSKAVEEAMQYLSEELDRINCNLDLILLNSKIRAPSCGSVQGVDNDEGQSSAANLDEITEQNDPRKVKQKGRPALTKRMKPLMEEIKQKIIR